MFDALAQTGIEAALGGPVELLLVALVVIGLVVLVGRLMLNVAWRVIKIATVVVGALWLVSVVAQSPPF